LIVYLPPGYERETRRYPVLYMQDGQNLFDSATAFAGQEWCADATADELICRGLVDPLIIVGVYNAGVRRISEYTPTRDPRRRKGGKGDRYAEMLAREVKPFIDGAYRTRRSMKDTGVGGSSLGALVSLQTALLYPRVFGKVVAMSPSVWWDDRAILKIVAAWKETRRPQLWIDAGTQEGDGVVEDLRLLRDVLREKGIDPGYLEVAGAGHNEAAWRARFGAILQFLFPVS